MKVYKAINAVQGELAKSGIGKDSENKFDNYKFRGIDAVYNALSPLLAKHGLCILPRMLGRSCEERTSKGGGALFYVTVDAEFDFVSAEDGSKHTIKTFGEAMDRGDKATNKAMSAAYKYAAFQAFAIPTEGDNDADAVTHEVTTKITPAAGAVDRLDAGRKEVLDRTVADCTALLVDGDIQQAFSIIQKIEDPDEKVYAWAQFDSKSRTAMKKHAESLKPEKKAA